MLSATALAVIGGYQRWISPRKGFSCAYRIAHGGTGCSGYAKRAIRDHGLIGALPLIRARFAACRTAAMALQEENPATPRRKKSKPCDACDCSGFGDFGMCRAAHGHSTTPDGCDCTPDGCDCTPDFCS